MVHESPAKATPCPPFSLGRDLEQLSAHAREAQKAARISGKTKEFLNCISQKVEHEILLGPCRLGRMTTSPRNVP